VLAFGDEQVIEAVDAGVISVSDAGSIAELPKPRQRELLDLVRSGKARTLHEAAKGRKPRELPQPVRASDQGDVHVMRGKVRRAYRYFKDDCAALFHYIDLAAEGSGGPNDFTRRAREALATAESAMEDCLQHYGRKSGESRSPAAAGNPRSGRVVRYSMPELS
jgi:hypothetical protein